MTGRFSHDEQQETEELHRYITEHSDLQLTGIKVQPTKDCNSTRFTVAGYLTVDGERSYLKSEDTEALLAAFAELTWITQSNLDVSGDCHEDKVRFEFTCYGLQDGYHAARKEGVL